MKRNILLAAFGVVLAAACALIVFWPDLTSPPPASIGGPFALIDQDGRAVTDRDLKGRPSLIYFGFTYCPEICPTTLAAETAWLHALGPDADRLNVVFVSIDPERDTPAKLKAYLSAFDPHIRGFTGSPEAVAGIAKAYRVYYKKIPLDHGEYTMDHSAAIYLMDANGRFVRPIVYGTKEADALGAIKPLLRP